MYRENEGMVLVCLNKEAISTERPERYGRAIEGNPREAMTNRRVTGGLLERAGSMMSRRRPSRMDEIRIDDDEKDQSKVEHVEHAG